LALSLRITRKLAHLLPRRDPHYRSTPAPQGRPKVLVVGVYVGNKPSLIDHIVEQLATATQVDLVQRWAAIGGASPSPAVDAVTVERIQGYEPKWLLLERLVRDAPDQGFDYVLFCDDDIWMGRGFLDALIGLQQAHGFAIAQPARTWRSYTDWPIVRRRLGLTARQTGFIESGPVVSMSHAFFDLATPFSTDSPMGWGYDLVWPKTAEKAGLTMGIIDAVPVDHSFRPRSQLYSYDKEIARMADYLSTRDHIREHVTYRKIR
jgi:hypothetical protein